jgi:hypothetical protein
MQRNEKKKKHIPNTSNLYNAFFTDVDDNNGNYYSRFFKFYEIKTLVQLQSWTEKKRPDTRIFL